jgi:hypothetical protein
MIKRVIFVGVVVLGVSSVASAGILDWLIGFPWTHTTPNSQQQGFSGTMGQIAVNFGSGTTSGTNGGTYSNTQTQTTPSGVTMTQSQTAKGTQTTSITGGDGSVGVSAQVITVKIAQSQVSF